MSTFPLGIELKEDLPQRLELVQNMPLKYWVPAAHFNKVLQELQSLIDNGTGSSESKYKGRFANLATINAAFDPPAIPPADGDYAYNNSGTLRFYALNGTWQSEVLSFILPDPAEIKSNIQDLVGDQANQIDRAVYQVVDASDDQRVVDRGGSLTAHYRYLGAATGDLTAYELLPADSNDQSSLNASTSLPASANGLKLFCNPNASMTVTLNHLNMASSHENFFINESASDITFQVLVSNSQDPDYTELVSPNGFVMNQNGTAFLIRKNGTNKLILNISNP